MSCAWCGGKDLAACTGCRCVSYCNTQCQASHWSRGHQTQCHLLAEVVEISARLSAQEQPIGQFLFIEKRPGEELEDTRPSKTRSPDEDAQKSSSPSEGISRRETNLRRVLQSPVPNDILRLISLMTLVDAASLMRASPAWRVLYEQIDWKMVILSRWDAPVPSVATTVDGDRSAPVQIKPIGQWLSDNSIFRLYPTVLLERSLYAPSPSQNERIVYINRERGRIEAEAMEQGRDRDEAAEAELARMEAALECEILLNRIQAQTLDDIDSRHALMNMCIFYRMYEHNEAVRLLDGPSGASLRQEQNALYIDLIGFRIFFPVEALSKTLKFENGAPLVDMVRDEWGQRDTPESLVDLDRYVAFMRVADPRFSTLGTRFNLNLQGVSNFPRVATLCSNLVRYIDVSWCPDWTEASFRNLGKMKELWSLSISSGGWSAIHIDFFATCPKLGVFDAALSDGVKMTASASLMQLQPLQNVFAVPRAYNPDFFNSRFDLNVSPTSDGIQYGHVRSRERVLPPGPFCGLSRDAHVRRIIESAFTPLFGKKLVQFAAKDAELADRLLRELEKKVLLLPLPADPGSENEYETLVDKFCTILEATAISPINGADEPDDPANIALPFRRWFNEGILYRKRIYASKSGELATVPSRAREACALSARARRGPQAYPSLEELAEALVGWRTSVYNLNVLLNRVAHARWSYCDYLVLSAVRTDVSVSTHYGKALTEMSWQVSAIYAQYVGGAGANRAFCFPHELAMAFVDESIRVMRLQDDTFVSMTLRGFYGHIPAWFWLAHPTGWTHLTMAEFDSVGVPVQLMYHRGLRVLRIRGSTAWGTPDKQPQWDLFHLRPESRTLPYCHDFEELKIENCVQTDIRYVPLIETAPYTLGLALEASYNQ